MGKARPSGHRVQRPRKSDHKSKLHQESERARPSERLRQEGKKRSAQGQTRAERSAVKAEKAKLRTPKRARRTANGSTPPTWRCCGGWRRPPRGW